MLNVAEDFEVTLDLLHQFEHDEFRIRSVDLGSRVIVIQGRVGYAREWHVVALDVHARTQFILPSLVGAAWGTHEVGFLVNLFCCCLSSSLPFTTGVGVANDGPNEVYFNVNTSFLIQVS